MSTSVSRLRGDIGVSYRTYILLMKCWDVANMRMQRVCCEFLFTFHDYQFTGYCLHYSNVSGGIKYLLDECPKKGYRIKVPNICRSSLSSKCWEQKKRMIVDPFPKMMMTTMTTTMTMMMAMMMVIWNTLVERSEIRDYIVKNHYWN